MRDYRKRLGFFHLPGIWVEGLQGNSKLDKARALGVTVLTEQEFLGMAQVHDAITNTKMSGRGWEPPVALHLIRIW